MFNNKCFGCGRKANKKFNFCPYCGFSFKQHREEEDFGMLGREDSTNFKGELKASGLGLPPGFEKLIGSLAKQLEKQMSNVSNDFSQNNQGMPKGFKIQISTGKPMINQVQPHPLPQAKERRIVISEKELERRKKLPREEAESNIRRLSDKIVYEIVVPGVKSEKDVVVNKFEDSVEIKAYSKDRCYYKAIPLKVEIIGYYVNKDTLFLELKN